MLYRIPSTHVPAKQNAQNFFSTKGIWNDEASHRAEVGKLYNSTGLNEDRKQLLSLMVDESETDSEERGEQQPPLTVKNLHQMLKVNHKQSSLSIYIKAFLDSSKTT